MSGFNGINQFGSLTLQNGQRLSFKDIKDVDGDGKISQDEFNAFLKENNVDTIELSLVDKNGDGEITEQEFAVLEQKQQMQEAVNAMAQDISIDFAGTTLIPEITAKLKELVANYENNYSGDVSKMAEAFKKELPANYENIKNEVLKIVNSHKNVKGFRHFNATPVGYRYQISFTIFVDGKISTFESHEIANDLEREIEKKIEEVYLTVIHVNPI